MSDNLEVSITESGSGTNKLIAAINQLASSSDKLAATTDKLAGATKRGDDAASKAAGSYDHLSKSLGGINSAAGSLQGALAGVGAALSLGKIVEAADAYTQMSNKLRLLTTDQTKINGILDKSFAIAQKTGTGFTEVANTYGKVADQAKKYNLTQEQVGKITQTIAQSIQLTGASAEEAQNGLRQFAQMLDSGQVQAEELNSIIDQTPGLAKALTAGLQASGVQITGTLKQMAESGKIGVKELLTGLEAIGPSIDKLATTSAPTLSAAMTRVNNAFIKYVGETDKANGFTAKMSSALGVLANNMDIAVPAAVVLTGLLAFGAVGAAINSLVLLGSTIATTVVPAVKALSLAMITNPLIAGIVVAALAAGSAAFYLFGDKIKAVLAPLLQTGTAAVQAALGIGQAKTATEGATTAATAAVAANDNTATSWRSVSESATQAATSAKTGAVEISSLSTTVGNASINLNDMSIAMNDFSTFTSTASTEVMGYDAAMENYIASLEEAAPATKSIGELIAENGRTMNKSAESTDSVAEAQKKLEINTQASAKASAAFNKTLDNIKSLNAYGEKLQTITEFLDKFRERQERANKAIEDSLDALMKAGQALREHEANLTGVTTTSGTAASSVRDLSSSLGSNTSALSSTSSAADEAASSYDRLGDSISRASSKRWTPGNDVDYSGTGGKTGEFGGTGEFLIQIGGKTVGSIPLETMGAGGAATNEIRMMRAQSVMQQFAGFEITDDNKEALKATLKSMLGREGFVPYPFATGGSFMVGGSGGTDSQNVAFRASPNERVTIETPRQVRRREEAIAGSGSSGPGVMRMVQNVGITVKTNDYDGFRRNEKQIGQDAAKRIRKAM